MEAPERHGGSTVEYSKDLSDENQSLERIEEFKKDYHDRVYKLQNRIPSEILVVNKYGVKASRMP